MFSSVNQESNILAGLLAIIGDPKAVKARIEQLQTMMTELDKAVKNAAEVEAKVVAREIALKGIEDSLASREIEINDKLAKCDEFMIEAREGAGKYAKLIEDANTRILTLARQEDDIVKTMNSLAERTKEIERDEAKVANKKKALDDREADLKAREEELEKKLSNLKAIVGN